MTDTLHAHLTEAGAEYGPLLGADLPRSFGDTPGELAALTSGAGLLNLSAFPRYSLTGRDRVRYLHGMSSADVKGLATGQGAYGTFMNSTGRTLSDTWYFAQEERILMILPPGVSEAVMAHLDFYLIADKADFEPIHEETALISLQGPRAASILEDLHAPLPEGPLAIAQGELRGMSVSVMSVDRGGAGGFDLLVSAADAPSLWGALQAAGATPAGMDALNIQRVMAGIPWTGKELTDKVIPMEAGLTNTAISFSKGCYIGQEVVAKIKYRGKVNRLLASFTLPEGAAPEEGAPLYYGGKEMGWLSSVVSPPEGPPRALGFLRRKPFEDASEIALTPEEGGPTATFERLMEG